MKRTFFGLAMPLLLFSDGGAAAQNGCPFGAFCGLSITWSGVVTNVATGERRPPDRVRVYVGQDGRVFRERPNGHGTGMICTKQGMDSEVTCRNGRCTDGTHIDVALQRELRKICKVSLEPGTLIIHFSETMHTTNQAIRSNNLTDGGETNYISLTMGNCAVSTDVMIRQGPTDGERPQTHYRGTSTSCTIFHGNILAR
jgi:hypothetical protein